MLRRRLLAVLIIPLALLLLATPLVGDQIYLKSGGRPIEGTVVAEHPDRIEVKLASGEVKTISRSDIAMIQKVSAGAAEFKTRLKNLEDDDLDGLLELAAWCGENRLRRQRLTVLKKAIKVDPDCPEANRALLKKWNGSRWVKDREKGKVPAPQAASKAKYEAIGLTLTTPTGWKAQDSGAKGLKLDGPSRYRQAVCVQDVAHSSHLDMVLQAVECIHKFSGNTTVERFPAAHVLLVIAYVFQPFVWLIRVYVDRAIQRENDGMKARRRQIKAGRHRHITLSNRKISSDVGMRLRQFRLHDR